VSYPTEINLKDHFKANQNKNTVMEYINGPMVIYSREIGKKTYFMVMEFINSPTDLNTKESS